MKRKNNEMSLYSFQHMQLSGGSKISTLFGKILFTPNPSKTFTHNDYKLRTAAVKISSRGCRASQELS